MDPGQPLYFLCTYLTNNGVPPPTSYSTWEEFLLDLFMKIMEEGYDVVDIWS